MPAFPFEIKLGMQHSVDLQTAARRKVEQDAPVSGLQKAVYICTQTS